MTNAWEVTVVASDSALYIDPEFDIFQKLPNGDVRWWGSVVGCEKAIAKLKEVAAKSPNEHFLFHTATKRVIARTNFKQELISRERNERTEPPIADETRREFRLHSRFRNRLQVSG